MNKSREGMVWGCLTDDEKVYIKASKEVEEYVGITWTSKKEGMYGCDVAYRRKPEVEAKKLPTLPDYIKEHGWPDWAKYATVSKSGIGCYHEKDSKDKQKPGICPRAIIEDDANVFIVFDSTNWQNSSVEKCDECNGKGSVCRGSNDGTDNFIAGMTCMTCNGTKIKPKQEPKRVPLTAKDYRNIRGIVLDDSGQELRILHVGSESLSCGKGDTSTKFSTYAESNYKGITFDNKIVPLYKEE